jgi:hypothetical protein
LEAVPEQAEQANQPSQADSEKEALGPFADMLREAGYL